MGMAALNLDGVTTGSKGYRPLPAGLARAESVSAWVCPHSSCGRVVTSGESETAPDCTLGPSRVPMAEYRTSM
ncbi:hypothetical protein ACFQ9X_33085 [Catenulispora yoronensis]